MNAVRRLNAKAYSAKVSRRQRTRIRYTLYNIIIAIVSIVIVNTLYLANHSEFNLGIICSVLLLMGKIETMKENL